MQTALSNNKTEKSFVLSTLEENAYELKGNS